MRDMLESYSRGVKGLNAIKNASRVLSNGFTGIFVPKFELGGIRKRGGGLGCGVNLSLFSSDMLPSPM